MNDLISRQAAIDALHMHLMYRMGTDSNKKRLDEWINNLPSAQPEVIRCTECKHYREYDSEYVENAVVVQCMADRYPISETIPDGWFCAGAERKDDARFNQQTGGTAKAYRYCIQLLQNGRTGTGD